MKKDILLRNEAAKALYEKASELPIVDYHCHLSPREIYEDKEYKIVLTQAPPEPSPEPEPTPDTSVRLSKTKGTAQELEQELDSHGISYTRNADEVALTDSAKIVTSDDKDLENMTAYTDQTYKIVPYK